MIKIILFIIGYLFVGGLMAAIFEVHDDASTFAEKLMVVFLWPFYMIIIILYNHFK